MKRKQGGSSNRNRNTYRELPMKGEDAEYAQVLKLLGDGRLEVQCMDGKTRMSTIRGAIYRKTRIVAGDWVLIGLRPFDDGKSDVLLKYTDDEVRQLQDMGVIKKLVSNVAEEFASDDEGDIDIDTL